MSENAMTVPECRRLPSMNMDGPTNMAADETMLRAAAESGIATLRFYGWTVPTLSLGYFQPNGLRSEDPLLTPLAWVRRASGGGAIVHHRELTYALALPGGTPWHTKESWTCRMHHVITTALQRFQVECRAVLCGEEKRLGERLCFLHQTPGDLLIGSSKIVGSAQRKLRGAILQHGSILLQGSPHTPSLPGIAELAGVVIEPEALANAIVEALPAETGWRFPRFDWSSESMARTEQIRGEKYATDDWNTKR